MQQSLLMLLLLLIVQCQVGLLLKNGLVPESEMHQDLNRQLRDIPCFAVILPLPLLLLILYHHWGFPVLECLIHLLSRAFLRFDHSFLSTFLAYILLFLGEVEFDGLLLYDEIAELIDQLELGLVTFEAGSLGEVHLLVHTQ